LLWPCRVWHLHRHPSWQIALLTPNRHVHKCLRQMFARANLHTLSLREACRGSLMLLPSLVAVLDPATPACACPTEG